MNQLEGRKLKISVVTPSHNRLNYLKEAIMSVQVNVLAPLDIEFEHIIHDCGSTDGTKDYFITNLPPERIFYIQDRGDNKESTKDRQWIQATDDLRKDGKGELADNIIFIRSEHKVPPSQARNICIQKSTGQYICVLVCDINFYSKIKIFFLYYRMMMICFFNVQFIILLMQFY
jgi:glycosyltransferase involved in cell wall biosynthesis